MFLEVLTAMHAVYVGFQNICSREIRQLQICVLLIVITVVHSASTKSRKYFITILLAIHDYYFRPIYSNLTFDPFFKFA